MKHIFVYNPTAGRSNRAVIEQLKEKMAADYADLDYEFYPTKAPGDASIYVRTRCEEEPDTVFRFYACGGDGTANEVLHGLIGGRLSRKVQPEKNGMALAGMILSGIGMAVSIIGMIVLCFVYSNLNGLSAVMMMNGVK